MPNRYCFPFALSRRIVGLPQFPAQNLSFVFLSSRWRVSRQGAAPQGQKRDSRRVFSESPSGWAAKAEAAGLFFSSSLFCGGRPSLFCWGLCRSRRLVRNYMEPFRALPAMLVPNPAAACGGRRRRRPSPILWTGLKSAPALFFTAPLFWAGCRAFFLFKGLEWSEAELFL